MSAVSDSDHGNANSGGPQETGGDTGPAALLRPDFFPGQLLTARDMSDIIDWTRANLALARWRDGWGAVRGLQVQAEPGEPLTLGIGPGYAVDPEGHNILVREADRFDLADYLTEQSGQSIAALDIAIAYHEDRSDPKPVLDQRSGDDGPDCVFTRTDEGYRIIAVPVKDPDGDAAETSRKAEAWRQGFADCLAVARRYHERFAGRQDGLPSGTEVADFLQQAIAERPLRLTPDLSARIAELSDLASVPEPRVVPLLFDMVQDYRLTYAASPPPEYRAGAHVPLARVHLSVADGRGGETRIAAVDAVPPFRRPLQRTPLPAPDGFVNIGSALGLPLTEAAAWLAGRGLNAEFYQAFGLSGIESVEELIQRLDFPPFIAAWDRPVVAFRRDIRDPRVVALRATASAALEDLSLARHSSNVPASPGSEIALTYRVTNTGRTRLDVTVRDSLLEESRQPVLEVRQLDPGESATSTVAYRVPERLPPPGPDGAVRLKSEVVANARGEQGSPLERRIEAVLPVAAPMELRLEQQVDSLVVRPGDTVTARVLLENTGHVDLDIELTLDAGGDVIALGDRRLEPRDSLAIEQAVTVPADAGPRFLLEATADASGPDGRRLRARAHYLLTLIDAPPGLRTLFCLAWLWLAGLFGR